MHFDRNIQAHGVSGRGKHAHGMGTHAHGHDAGAGTSRLLGAAIAATLVLVCVELTAGYAGHSIALASDAVHNATDVPTLVISWLAARWALRPPTPEKTYGYHRGGILAAFVNAMLMVFAALSVIYISIVRLRHPVAVHAGMMLWVALLALVINGGIALGVHEHRRDLNVRTVWIHNLGDALSNIAVFAGALAIRWSGAQWIDAALGIGIGGMVLWTVGGILRESGHILLEGLPRNMRLEDVARAVLGVEGVQEVHDIHIWTLGTDLQALSCHIRIPDMHMEECEKIQARIREALERDFHITHVTVQFERAGLPAEAGPYMPEAVRGPRK
jgi:cobalt-zinc-cadmium efflux system protein